MFKTLLSAVVVLFLSVGVAHGAWQIKQRSDGTTVWENNRTHEQMSIGTPFLTLRVTDVSVAGTTMMVIPTTAEILRIDVVADGAIRNQSSSFTFWIRAATDAAAGGASSTHPRDFRRVSGRAGQVSFSLATSTTTAYTAFITPTGSNIVPAGSVFAVFNDGLADGSSEQTPILFTITLAPTGAE